jgi:hypothetical protein
MIGTAYGTTVPADVQLRTPGAEIGQNLVQIFNLDKWNQGLTSEDVGD